jgi:hypothetical protein
MSYLSAISRQHAPSAFSHQRLTAAEEDDPS